LILEFTPLKCIGCGRCEMACGYYRDRAYTAISSSIMFYRAEEKNNYFGLLYKTDTELVLARPEGLEVSRIGASMEGEGSGSAAKPILLRQGCDECEQPLCARACPTEAIQVRRN